MVERLNFFHNLPTQFSVLISREYNDAQSTPSSDLADNIQFIV